MSDFAPIEDSNESNQYKRKQTVESKPIITWLEDVEIEKVTWLWDNRIPIGKLTLISGDPCLGKSTFTMDIAARVSSGAPWADSLTIEREPGGVVILSAEDGLADTIKPRLQAAGAKMKRIISLDAVQRFCDGVETESAFSLGADVPQLREAIQQVEDCRLVIIDPISAYLGSTDSHKDSQVRGLLAPLAKLAEDTGVAIILVAHLNKSNGKKAIYRTGGSIAFTAAMRAAFVVVKDTKDPERRLFLPTKNNLAPGDIGGLAYTVEGVNIPSDSGDVSAPVVRIDPEAIDSNADDYMVEPNGDTDDQDDAAEWLGDTLTGGVLGSTEVFRMARQQGFTNSVIRRAFKRLGGKPKKTSFDGGWKWELP
jgi:putative DNA primase/helicase